MAVLKAQFIRFYGVSFYQNQQLWPTRDGIVPWQIFYARLRDMHACMALERINMAQAMAQAFALTSGQKKAIDLAKNLFKNWANEAYPPRREARKIEPEG